MLIILGGVCCDLRHVTALLFNTNVRKDSQLGRQRCATERDTDRYCAERERDKNEKEGHMEKVTLAFIYCKINLL